MNLDSRTPLIVTAMPSELRHLLEVTSRAEREQIGPWVRWTSELDGRPLKLLLTGIGMVNAGAALARAMCDLRPEFIINYGCAGAHRADLVPGDVVIGDRYVHHRSVTVLSHGEERYVGTPVAPEDTSIFVKGFEADSQLIGFARAASADWTPDPWPVPNEAGRDPKVFTGPVTSADCWTQATDLIERIHAEHGTLCEDMEAAALAQVAKMHEIPFLAVKDISNNEFHAVTDLGDGGGPSLLSVEAEVGQRAANLVRRILQCLSW